MSAHHSQAKGNADCMIDSLYHPVCPTQSLPRAIQSKWYVAYFTVFVQHTAVIVNFRQAQFRVHGRELKILQKSMILDIKSMIIIAPIILTNSMSS